MTEALQFIEAKDLVARDENYRDLTNLKGKLQKFQAFNAELSGYGGRVDTILASGEVGWRVASISVSSPESACNGSGWHHAHHARITPPTARFCPIFPSPHRIHPASNPNRRTASDDGGRAALCQQ